MSEFLKYEQDGAVVTLTMNAPEVRNALTGNAAVDEFVAAVERIMFDRQIWARTAPRDGLGGAPVFAYCRGGVHHQANFHARMFSPDVSIPEDPATGSAVAAFAGAVMRFERPGDGEHRLVIEQGYEIGRPSQIELGLRVVDGTLVSATIGGMAVVMSEGHLL